MIRIHIAQINPTIGDLEGNLARIQEEGALAHAHGAEAPQDVAAHRPLHGQSLTDGRALHWRSGACGRRSRRARRRP